jgi:membrane protein YdbS with pleckstrin-like domain
MMADEPHGIDQDGKAFVAGAPPSDTTPTSPAPGQPGTKPQAGPEPGSEQDLWSGRASWKSLLPPASLGVVLILVVTIVVQLIFHRAAVTLTVLTACAVLLLLLLGRTTWRILSVSYRLTSQRLFVRRGILTQTVDQTELLRVDDVRVRQTIIQRMLGIGQVEVISSDRSDAELVLRDVLDPEAVSEHVRRHTRTVQRRTLFMEQL